MAQCFLGSNPAASLEDVAQWLTLTNQNPASNDWFPEESVETIVNAWSVTTKLIRIPVVPLDETDSIDVARYAYLQGMHLASLSTASGSIIFADYNYSDHAVVHVLNFEQANWTTHVMIALYNTIDDVEQDNIAPVSSAALHRTLKTKQDVFVDTTIVNVTSIEDLGTKFNTILESTNFAVRMIADGSSDSFLYDCRYFAIIFKRGSLALAKLFNQYNPGQDVYVYCEKTNGVLTWTGPYWTNPPYVSGEAYLLAERMEDNYDLYGMYLEIELDAAVNESKIIDLNDALGGKAIYKVVDFSYHVDNYLTEFNSVNEYIQIQYGSSIVISYSTTKSHTIYLKLKFIEGEPT